MMFFRKHFRDKGAQELLPKNMSIEREYIFCEEAMKVNVIFRGDDAEVPNTC